MPRQPDKKKPSKAEIALASQVGDMVCGVLHTVYVDKRESFRKESREKGVPVESLAAAAITQIMQGMGAFGGIPAPSPAKAGQPNPHHDFPPIPEIPANLVEPIKCLARVASFFHRSTVEAYSDHLEDMPAEGKESLAIYESILQQWLDHSGVTEDDLLGDDDE